MLKDVIPVDNRLAARDMVRQGSIDLAIIDLNMPMMDSIELTKEIRKYQNYNSLPVIAQTISNNEDTINNAYDAGANDDLTICIYKKL